MGSRGVTRQHHLGHTVLPLPCTHCRWRVRISMNRGCVSTGQRWKVQRGQSTSCMQQASFLLQVGHRLLPLFTTLPFCTSQNISPRGALVFSNAVWKFCASEQRASFAFRRPLSMTAWKTDSAPSNCAMCQTACTMLMWIASKSLRCAKSMHCHISIYFSWAL